ncbi:DUF881 domain-containing protein [Nocardioides litoris]|uniref:DUF881 domain-containing protein n=1 Tax=Nocardioides litoris TaxID=1926648 RepID=UPI001FEB493D|nr:DUF881 domain-containing protein [Nocardioides litoris]
MTTPEPAVPDRPRRSAGWRFGTPAVVLVCGALFVVSGTNSQGTDLRPGRYTSLASLTEGASRSYQDLQARADRLGAEVEQLTEQVDDAAVRKERRRAERLRGPAGLEPVSGEGVTIVMSDAPEEQIEEAVGRPDAQADVDLMVVHQQDLQAVVNALWAGGAAAVTLQGQRLVTTTGIQCSGSQVQLQGVPYPEPYTIQAVGDPDALVAALDDDADVAGFRYDALRPEVGVGWDLTEDEVEAPAYDGLLDLEVAEPRTS